MQLSKLYSLREIYKKQFWGRRRSHLRRVQHPCKFLLAPSIRSGGIFLISAFPYNLSTNFLWRKPTIPSSTKTLFLRNGRKRRLLLRKHHKIPKPEKASALRCRRQTSPDSSISDTPR